jgi:hypothetical protein
VVHPEHCVEFFKISPHLVVCPAAGSPRNASVAIGQRPEVDLIRKDAKPPLNPFVASAAGHFLDLAGRAGAIVDQNDLALSQAAGRRLALDNGVAAGSSPMQGPLRCAKTRENETAGQNRS